MIRAPLSEPRAPRVPITVVPLDGTPFPAPQSTLDTPVQAAILRRERLADIEPWKRKAKGVGRGLSTDAIHSEFGIECDESSLKAPVASVHPSGIEGRDNIELVGCSDVPRLNLAQSGSRNSASVDGTPSKQRPCRILSLARHRRSTPCSGSGRLTDALSRIIQG
ncbi:hypothetical protein NMY22_g11982 [Coprinellus aureogranulatus]|nr:hypothetical protein NMY22_g11982 [Coprinellus aureogranulatus]